MKIIKKFDLRYKLLTLAVLIFLSIIFGGVVRVTNSSLDCGGLIDCLLNSGYGSTDLYVLMHHLISVLAGVLLVLVVISQEIRTAKRLVKWPTFIGLGLIILQGIMLDNGSEYRALHFANSLLVFGLVLVSMVISFAQKYDQRESVELKFRSLFAKQTILNLIAIFVILLSGIGVTSVQQVAYCSTWPICFSEMPQTLGDWYELIHQIFVGLSVILVLWMLNSAWRTQRTQRAILTSSTLTVILFFGQAFVGSLVKAPDSALYLTGLHIASSASVWASIVIQTIFVGWAARETKEELAELETPIIFKDRFADLLKLTKPIIVVLLLVTTYTGMVVGGKAIPSFSLTFWTLLSGAMAAGGSGAINQYIDREIDKKMVRTAKRPIAAGRMYPAEGLAFGLGLLFISFYIMAGLVNLLAALLSLAGMIYYVILYSLMLKTSSEQNIVIGGGAGAIPPLVGWAAVTGSLNLTALFLFVIIFMWTPPHFWALALIRKKDYAEAGIPMMPVVRGEEETRWQIWVYTLELVGITLLMPVFNMAGLVYLISAVGLGGGLIYYAWKVWKSGGNKLAWRMYRYSSMYLGFLFIALIVDAIV